MTRALVKLALGASLAMVASPSDVFAGRGGGRGGGYGGESRGGMQGGGSSMSHSPSFSQPHSSTGAGNRNASSNNPNAGAAAAGAGASNRNQSSNHSNAGAAAAGAGYSNRNQSPNVSNAGAAAAGAGYSNRNQGPSNAGAAAAGAGYANRNQSGNFSNAGAAAAGARYANRNQSGNLSNAGAAAAGAGYANRNQYDQYHPGMAYGTWNGNYGTGIGAYGGMAIGAPASGYASAAYMNPYAVGGPVATGGGQAQPANVPGNNNQPSNPAAYDYSKPVNPTAAPPDTPATDPGASPVGQARQAFQSGDYATALTLTQQAIGQMPNDVSLHEFLALDLFAQGKYEQAAAPLYAVLSVGPGWNWTTLSGNYSDVSVYSQQLRGLEAFVKANPKSAKAQFVLAYHYISQGQGEAAIRPLQNVVALQPNDKLSAQLIEMLQPPKAAAAAP